MKIDPEYSMRNLFKVFLDTSTKNLKRAELKHWIKFSDGRSLDIISLG